MRELQASLYTESYKDAIKVLHLTPACVKNSRPSLHSNNVLLLSFSLAVFEDAELEEAVCCTSSPLAPASLTAPGCCRALPSGKEPLVLPKIKVYLGLYGAFPPPAPRGAGPGVALAPCEGSTLPNALPAHPCQGGHPSRVTATASLLPPLIAMGPQKPWETTGTIEG